MVVQPVSRAAGQSGSAGAKGVVGVFVPGPFAVFGWGVEVEPAVVEAFAEGVLVDPVGGGRCGPWGLGFDSGTAGWSAVAIGVGDAAGGVGDATDAEFTAMVMRWCRRQRAMRFHVSVGPPCSQCTMWCTSRWWARCSRERCNPGRTARASGCAAGSCVGCARPRWGWSRRRTPVKQPVAGDVLADGVGRVTRRCRVSVAPFRPGRRRR